MFILAFDSFIAILVSKLLYQILKSDQFDKDCVNHFIKFLFHLEVFLSVHFFMLLNIDHWEIHSFTIFGNFTFSQLKVVCWGIMVKMIILKKICLFTNLFTLKRSFKSRPILNSSYKFQSASYVLIEFFVKKIFELKFSYFYIFFI